MGKSLKPTQASPEGGRERDLRKLRSPGLPSWADGWLLCSGSQTILPLRNDSHHTCFSSNSQRRTSSPGWTRWINTSKYVEVQESRAKSGRGTDPSVCCYRSSKGTDLLPAGVHAARTYPKPQGITSLFKTQQRTPSGLKNNILKTTMITLTSEGNKVENKIELQQSLNYITMKIFPASGIYVP